MRADAARSHFAAVPEQAGFAVKRCAGLLHAPLLALMREEFIYNISRGR